MSCNRELFSPVFVVYKLVSNFGFQILEIPIFATNKFHSVENLR
jgi:hypothetical protein